MHAEQRTSDLKPLSRKLAIAGGGLLVPAGLAFVALSLYACRPLSDWFPIHEFSCEGLLSQCADWPPDWYPGHQAERIPNAAADLSLMWGGRDPFTFLRFGAEEYAARKFFGEVPGWDDTNLGTDRPNKPFPWGWRSTPGWWLPPAENDGFYGVRGGSGAGAYFFYDKVGRTVYYMNWTS